MKTPISRAFRGLSPSLVTLGFALACACSTPDEPGSADAKDAAASSDGGGKVVECKTDQECAIAAAPCVKGVCKGGFCSSAPRDNGQTCDDGNSCTSGDVCDDGMCVGSGACQCQSKGDCAAFEDGDLCNGVLFGDLATRTCKLDPSTATTCDPTVSKHCTVQVCVPKTGACEAIPAKPGAACDDGLACTSGDKCGAGGCVGVPSTDPKACDDGDLCTDDECAIGKGCVSLPMKATCDDGDGCTTDTCEPAKGCVNLPIQTTCTK